MENSKNRHRWPVILFSHPTGNTNVRNAALALHQAKMLHSFHTTYCHQKSILRSPIVPNAIRRSLERRRYPDVLLPSIHDHPRKELLRHLASKLRAPEFVSKRYTVDSVYKNLDQICSRQTRKLGSQIQAVYCYEDGAEKTFEAASELDLTRFYDLPIGYWRAARRIMREEAERNPAWASTIPGNFDSDAKLARKDAELNMATHIFVASTFTRKTLEECPDLKAPVSVIPYGSPPLSNTSQRSNYSRSSETLKILFVGSLSQRKGLSYLFEAINELGKHVELTVVGQKPKRPCKALDQALLQHDYITSAPHSEILDLMQEHDVFVFPSLFEGFGLVLIEAMSQGMPIITTTHTAGPDLITDGKEGYIVPIASSQAIQEKLAKLLSDRELLREMGQAARKKSKKILWENYRNSLARECFDILQNESNSFPEK